MSGTLQLTGGPGGLSAGPFPATLGTTLAIGTTEPVTIALDMRVPAGPWDALITLQSGLLQRTARATVIFPARGRAASGEDRTRRARMAEPDHYRAARPSAVHRRRVRPLPQAAEVGAPVAPAVTCETQPVSGAGGMLSQGGLPLTRFPNRRGGP